MWYFASMFFWMVSVRARSVANGPPGATRTMKKLRVMMMSIVGIIPMTRFTMYLVIGNL